jgi:hypothetical protein
MSDNKVTTTKLREGHQGAQPANRGHQVALDKGYQPNTQISVLQPPLVGSTTVVPAKNGTANSVETGKK